MSEKLVWPQLQQLLYLVIANDNGIFAAEQTAARRGERWPGAQALHDRLQQLMLVVQHGASSSREAALLAQKLHQLQALPLQ